MGHLWVNANGSRIWVQFPGQHAVNAQTISKQIDDQRHCFLHTWDHRTWKVSIPDAPDVDVAM